MQNRQSSKLLKETMRFLDKMLLFTGAKSRPALLETGCMTVYNSCHGEEKRHKRREMNAGREINLKGQSLKINFQTKQF